MESDIHDTVSIRDAFLNRRQLNAQLARIEKAATIAQKRMDYVSAHDEGIQHAIEVVEEFLRKKHRLCYGGQAINAHLPTPYQFYSREYSLPDYDFFTPTQSEDIRQLVKSLRKAGFQEISAREGMHEGTVKIYVDYTPVADITAMDPKLYRILSKREFRSNGISYVDANTLRMMMYLELSRPQGEVSRWPKVYERLALFNEFARDKQCTKKEVTQLVHGELSAEQVHHTLQFILEHRRIFAGGDLLTFYRHVWKNQTKTIDWVFRSKKPILFYSSQPEQDAAQLLAEFQLLDEMDRRDPMASSSSSVRRQRITVKTIENKGVDLLPSLTIVQRGKSPLVLLIHESACHSYLTVPMKDNQYLRIASMDTLITLYFSMGLLNTAYFNMGSMECLANQLVELSVKTRKHPDRFSFPFISITCAGHQTSMSSLIRAKVERILKKKKALQSVMQARSTTTRRHRRGLQPTIKKKKPNTAARPTTVSS